MQSLSQIILDIYPFLYLKKQFYDIYFNLLIHGLSIYMEDMWAVGCIFAELLTLKPLFQGQEVKGTPNPFQVGFFSFLEPFSL